MSRAQDVISVVPTVQDPATKRQFDPPIGTEIGRRALKHGMLTRFDPHWLALGPPLVVNEEQIDEMIDILDQSISDEIYFDLVSYAGYLQDNGDTDSSGVELIGELPIMDNLKLRANYTYNDTETVAGSTRARRPKHLANLGIEWQPLAETLVLGLNVRAVQDTQETDGSKMDDYQVVNLNASWNVFGGLEIYGRIENLLDEDYEEVPTYNTSGRAAYAGIRYAF